MMCALSDNLLSLDRYYGQVRREDKETKLAPKLIFTSQSVAQADCQFRAMKDGHRWVFNGDWDEYLLLKPADNRAWPPPATSLPSSSFADWSVLCEPSRLTKAEPSLFRATTVEKIWNWPETLPRLMAGSYGLDTAVATYGTLPAAFTFMSSFGCLECAPSSAEPPPKDLTLRLPSIDWLAPGVGFLSLWLPQSGETSGWVKVSRVRL